ncbi:protein-tyrosine phosphatase [Pseudoxanthomonas sp. GM95]|uniref:low molecular weight protein-tyrosine-phosphatase n=1 Tax=Pseudoxanthomonas sp. GM95 TaxID=1881043 RepID=UPI0008D7DD7D|nr:low molecular weight protein-tyrosine-phosphatase [Pseudoxanthomonas sp. GM95]SEL75012.1 protein-tyrosine phosphatase [Pseudoxanthomonas sp. GM95]
MTQSLPSVLFVCTGNICRSPTAHALLLHKAAALGLVVHTDSAAVTEEEIGNPPDRRALQELRRRGVPMPAHRARQVQARDFTQFDLVLGMTAAHVRALQRMAPAHATARIDLLMRYAEDENPIDVPDPWYGGPQDFIEAFDMIEAGVEGVLARRGRLPR